jgi:aldose 1-epimerase
MPKQMAVMTETFGTLKDGREARLFTISTRSGSSVTLTDFGAAVVRLLVPDVRGRLEDVALGFDQLSLYEQDLGNFGAVCGRVANRLSRASLPLDRRVYPLVRNDGPNTLHGGAIGFHHRLWDAQILGEDAVRFSRFSPDGEEGFPGDLDVSVTYRFSEDLVLSLDFEAAAGEKNTVANLTNHSYWNLDGNTFGSILDHSIRLHASRFTPVNEFLVPDGRVLPVKGVFDLRAYRSLREGIASQDEQILLGNGYDHNFLLDGYDGTSLVPAADLRAALSGRRMEVWTTMPGIQLYTGNHFDRLTGKGGMRYNKSAGVALETQFYPDAPHHPAWPQPTVKAGQIQRSRTEFRFFAE